MSQKSSIVRFSVFVVGFLGLGGGGGGGGAKIMSQKSSIVTSLVSFVSVLVVVLLHVAAVFVDVLTSGVGVLTSSSRSGCPCLSNGPNCRQEYTCTCALIYTHTHTRKRYWFSKYILTVSPCTSSFLPFNTSCNFGSMCSGPLTNTSISTTRCRQLRSPGTREYSSDTT